MNNGGGRRGTHGQVNLGIVSCQLISVAPLRYLCALCPLCSLVHRNRRQKKKKIWIKTENWPQCAFCVLEVTHLQATLLPYHALNMHKRAKPCPICGQMFFPGSLPFHMKECEKKAARVQLPCQYCDQEHLKSEMEAHLKRCPKRPRRPTRRQASPTQRRPPSAGSTHRSSAASSQRSASTTQRSASTTQRSAASTQRSSYDASASRAAPTDAGSL